MNEQSVMTALALERKRYTALTEVMELTEELSQAFQRQDQVSVQMFLRMRQEPVNQLREYQALERKQQELMVSFREAHGGDAPLLEEVLEMEDTWASAGERACAAHFFLGLQMGLDLGKLNYLREE